MKWLGRWFWAPVRDGENWAQTLVRVAGNLLRWAIGLPIVFGLLGWGALSFHSWWSDRPYRLTGLEGVEIGMTTTEVTLIKGAPQSKKSAGKDLFAPPVIEYRSNEGEPLMTLEQQKAIAIAKARARLRNSQSEEVPIASEQEDNWWEAEPLATYAINWQTGEVLKRYDADGWKPVASVRNKTTGEILIDEGAGWVPVPSSKKTQGKTSPHEVMRFDDLVVFFGESSKKSWTVYRVCLTSPRRYDKVMGVSGSDTEAEVIRHLGQPDSVKIDADGLGKRSFFERYNMMLRFEQARVVAICAGT